MSIYWISLAAVFAVLVGNCSPMPATSENSPDSTSTTDQPQENATQIPSDQLSENQISPINTLDSSEVPAPPPEANPFVKMVEEDLAGRLNTTANQIRLLKISEIDWQDITQGCTSSPGQTLTKSRVSGYRIWLETNGKIYLYHIGLDDTIFLCPD